MPQSLKPEPLRPGDAVRILSLSSPVQEARLQHGIEEMKRLGFAPSFDPQKVLAAGGFFRRKRGRPRCRAERSADGDRLAGDFLFARRLRIELPARRFERGARYPEDSDGVQRSYFAADFFVAEIPLGHSVRADGCGGVGQGSGRSEGYDAESFTRALTETKQGWTIELAGTEAIMPGAADGVLLGGCLTLIETALGTPWELDTHGAILLLEDRGMKPWQVDRALMHLKQAGKLRGVSGVLLGDFPECEAPPGSETVFDVARRILGTMGFPVVWGAPVGHTARAMLTVPLGVRARLRAGETSRLDILEAACRG